MTDFLVQLREAAPVILSLIAIEGLLSVDNILAIAALATSLPDPQRKMAVRLGLAGAYLYRGLALLFASYILEYEWVKFIGAFYLIHLMAGHFSDLAAETDDDPATRPARPRTFFGTILSIQLMDLSLSVDNVIAAVAMSPKFWVVCTGVGLGLVTLWMFATLSLRLVERYPILKHTAFVLIGYVGLILLVEMSAEYALNRHLHLTSVDKFLGLAAIIVLSLWYARSERLRTFCAPGFAVLMLPIRLYARVSQSVASVILWPFKWAARVPRKSPPQDGSGPRPH